MHFYENTNTRNWQLPGSRFFWAWVGLLLTDFLTVRTMFVVAFGLNCAAKGPDTWTSNTSTIVNVIYNLRQFRVKVTNFDKSWFIEIWHQRNIIHQVPITAWISYMQLIYQICLPVFYNAITFKRTTAIALQSTNQQLLKQPHNNNFFLANIAKIKLPSWCNETQMRVMATSLEYWSQ